LRHLNFVKRIIKFKRKQQSAEKSQLFRQVSALYSLMANLYGSDQLILKAGKLDAVDLLRSKDLAERVLGLERVAFEDPTIGEVPSADQIPGVLGEIEEELAELVARRAVEEKLERRVAEKMQDRHEEYVRDIKLQLLKEEGAVENAYALKKYDDLEKLEQRRLSKSALEILRPKSLQEVVGQERAVKSLLAKIASPYPQHVILYGPPGVGKTTVARLALAEAKKLGYTPFTPEANFVEVDGATLRWDPREVSNPLLGSVHDPIYQGAKRELADGSVPEPKLGLVTEASGGVLFIDEIGEMDPLLQNKLLKVLEDKRVAFDSSYYDPDDPNVPKYIKKLFDEGAPADFILIGATTREPGELNPALRSRATEVFFEPLTPPDIQEIIRQAAVKLGVQLADGVTELIADYTIEGRKATNILADAYGVALYRNPQAKQVQLTLEDLKEVIQLGRLTPNVITRASHTAEVGKIFGLGVSNFWGSVLEIEAVAFPAREKGQGKIRFNETAGSMAKDSVFNAASVVRRLTGEDMGEYDIHVNVIGGGLIDGPSAGLAILLAITSSITNKPIWQDVAVTGEVSIRGTVKAVGGIPEKIYGAKQAEIRRVLVPQDNILDVPAGSGMEIIPVSTAEKAMALIFAPAEKPALGKSDGETLHFNGHLEADSCRTRTCEGLPRPKQR
jgi:ATP-dependent Lon protease